MNFIEGSNVTSGIDDWSSHQFQILLGKIQNICQKSKVNLDVSDLNTFETKLLMDVMLAFNISHNTPLLA